MRRTHEFRPLQQPWIYRGSHAKLLFIAILIALVAWFVNSGIDLLWAKYKFLNLAEMSAVDALLSIFFGVLAFKLMHSERDRFEKIVHQLEIVAEMNHHIRNALEVIQLRVHATKDQELISETQQSLARIEWTLRELLPRTTDGERGVRRNEKNKPW